MRLTGDLAARRRLGVLAATAALALGVGIASGAGSDGKDPPTRQPTNVAPAPTERPSPVARLSLRRQLGQLLISSFDGTTLPDYMRRRLRAGQVSGVILFAPNATTRADFRRLGRALQRAADGSALVAVDQEGGEIRNLRFAGPLAGQPWQGSAAEIRRQARRAGRQLRGAGVNVTLAPVADVAGHPGSVMASRAFAGSPRAVAAKVGASVRGWLAGGVGPTAKHFPGLGAATVNTDDGSAKVAPRARRDLPPFRAAIAANVPLVMLSHALYPPLDRNHIASQSKPIVTGLLRRRLGFDGVIVTDSLEAQAVLNRSDIATAAERSLAAGADLILMTGSASWNEVYPRLLRRARRDPAFRTRVHAGATRVLELKRRLGLRVGGPAG